MNQWDKIEIVQQMQNYIQEHIHDTDFQIDNLYSLVHYSKRHTNRIFKELLGQTPLEYIKVVQLSKSAIDILHKDRTILDIALNSNFESHEGYTRAFTSRFGLSPSEYRKDKTPIPLFIQYPIKHYYSYLNNKEISNMSKETNTCFITVVNKPQRKLLVMYSENAKDYWTFSEEKGCEWEGLFNSISSKLDTAAILELPDHLLKNNHSKIAAGVELPIDYNGNIPNGCELITLEACDIMYFQSEPFENDDDFGPAIASVFKALEKYNPKQYGYEISYNLAPTFNFGASKEMGAKLAIPVKCIDN